MESVERRGGTARSAVMSAVVVAVGFFDGAETPAEGWQLEGWTQVGAQLPQSWSVQVIEWRGGVPQARRLPVDASGRATWSPSDAADRAVLAVSGTAPVTLQRAQYTVDIAP